MRLYTLSELMRLLVFAYIAGLCQWQSRASGAEEASRVPLHPVCSLDIGECILCVHAFCFLLSSPCQ